MSHFSPYKKTEIKAFPLDRFFDRYSAQLKAGNETNALEDLKRTITLHTKIDDNFIYIGKSLKKAGYHKCADYMSGIIALDKIEQVIFEKPKDFEGLDDRDDLDFKYRGVTMTKLEDGHTDFYFRTFKRRVWALCLDQAPNSESFAMRNTNAVLFCHITHGEMLDYRQKRVRVKASFKKVSVPDKAAEKHTQEAVSRMRQTQPRLKRRPKR